MPSKGEHQCIYPQECMSLSVYSYFYQQHVIKHFIFAHLIDKKRFKIMLLMYI